MQLFFGKVEICGSLFALVDHPFQMTTSFFCKFKVTQVSFYGTQVFLLLTRNAKLVAEGGSGGDSSHKTEGEPPTRIGVASKLNLRLKNLLKKMEKPRLYMGKPIFEPGGPRTQSKA